MGKRKKMNILFVCKFNRFRSRVAEAYFRKINKDRKIKVSSAGIFIGKRHLMPIVNKTISEFKLKLRGEPKAISTEFLIKQDRIIIVADDVPRNLFNSSHVTGKIDVWKISDVHEHSASAEDIRKVIKEIIFHVDRLKGEIENERSN